MDAEISRESNEDLNIHEYNFDSDLIESVSASRVPGWNVYQHIETAVILGRGSKPEKEINYSACQEDETPVYQRLGGGCAVVLDSGNIIVSVVLPTTGFVNNQQYFNKLSQWLIRKLEDIGVNGVYQDGTSDLVYQGRKIGGSSIQRTKDYLYYSTTLLVNPQVQMLERYLKYPPREPDYRLGRSHKDFVGSLPVANAGELVEILSVKLSEETVIEELKQLI